MSAQLLLRASKQDSDRALAARGPATRTNAGIPVNGYARPADADTGVHIDDILGDANDRFFGAGYRRVSQQIVHLGWDPTAGQATGRAVNGLAAIAYPTDWSRKEGGTVAPHLTSVDALTLSVRLVDAFLANGFQLSPGQVARAWLRRFVMKSGGAPDLDLDQVGLRIVERGSGPSQLLPGAWNSQFDCTVGNIRVRCEIEHDFAMRPWPGLPLQHPFIIPAAPFHTNGFHHRVHDITEVTVDVSAQSASATVYAADAVAQVPTAGELGGAFQPSLTMLDSMILLAQVGQVMVYELDGLDRAQTNTLWMRKVDMWRDSPFEPLAGPVRCNTFVKRATVIDYAGARWRALNMAGACGNTTVQYSVGHEMPENGQTL